jgi:hypothetical protein
LWSTNETSQNIAGLSEQIYMVTVTDDSGCFQAASISVISTNTVTLNLKVYLEGYYTGNGLMDNYGSGGLLYITGISANPQDADTVYISAVDINTFAEIDRQPSILKTDGTVNVSFNSSVIPGNYYYIKVNHRNSIETWSASPVLFNTPLTYNFSDQASKAYGSNMVSTFDGSFAFWSGDISDQVGIRGLQDGIIESQDYSDMENAVYIILLGYVPEDITGDGVVESADYSIVENNVYYIIFSMHP